MLPKNVHQRPSNWARHYSKGIFDSEPVLNKWYEML